MKIYDISQEVFGCEIFPGDPKPEKEKILKISKGEVCNLTAFSMCAHNGTHVDAMNHFYNDGKTIDKIPLDSFIGHAYVAEFQGDIEEKDVEKILSDAKAADKRAADRILIKGNAVLTAGAAKVLAKEKIKLWGNESQTVGPEDTPKEVHMIMLGAEIVLLEGVRLDSVKTGVYLLNAAPLNLGGADGAPCRAVLIEE